MVSKVNVSHFNPDCCIQFSQSQWHGRKVSVIISAALSVGAAALMIVFPSKTFLIGCLLVVYYTSLIVFSVFSKKSPNSIKVTLSEENAQAQANKDLLRNINISVNGVNCNTIDVLKQKVEELVPISGSERLRIYNSLHQGICAPTFEHVLSKYQNVVQDQSQHCSIRLIVQKNMNWGLEIQTYWELYDSKGLINGSKFQALHTINAATNQEVIRLFR